MDENTPPADQPAAHHHPAVTEDLRSVTAIHTRLREAILRHEIALDEPVSQVQLAREMGVSRSPLREALKMLEREGLIVAEPNRRVRVAGVSTADLEQLYAMRITLEAFAVSVTIPRLTSGELQALEASVDEMDDRVTAHDHEGWNVLHRAFHRGLIQHAGERILVTTEQLSDHAERYRRIYLEQPLSYTNGAHEHRQIFAACRDRRPEEAAVQLSEHFARTALSVLAVIDPGHEPALVREALRTARAGAAR